MGYHSVSILRIETRMCAPAPYCLENTAVEAKHPPAISCAVHGWDFLAAEKECSVSE